MCQSHFMFAVLLSWIVSFVIFAALGCIVQKILFPHSPKTPFYTIFNGMFAYMLLVWLTLYLGGFQLYFQLAVLLFSLFYLGLNRQKCTFFKDLVFYFRTLSFGDKLLLFISGLLLIVLSAGVPHLPDNESYYIHTIKWANRQGFTYGLMNVHPFLGQFSGWHILQSGVNLANPWFTANALNGFLLWLFIAFVLFDSRNNFYPWLKLSVLFAGLWVYFSSSPSPDLPVWLLSLLIFDLFIRHFQQIDRFVFRQLSLLVFFSVLIKPTAIINLILWLVLLFKHYKKLKKDKVFIGVIILFSAILWSHKNYMLTGYIAYPFGWGTGWLHPAWQYPRELLQYLGKLGHQESYAVDLGDNFISSFIHWLSPEAIPERIFNPLFLLLLVLFPFFLSWKKPKHYKAYAIIYSTGLLYFLILLTISPNIRFLMPVLMFVILVLLLEILPEFLFKKMYYAGLLLLILSLFYGVSRKPLIEGQLVFPLTSKLNYRFKKARMGNFDYHYPYNKDLFWETGDAPLPAVHQNMIMFFKERFGYLPQHAENNLKGYIMKKVR